MAMTLFFLIVSLLAATPAVYATNYVVGDSSGWNNNGVNYNNWASGKNFNVGDNLIFNYGPQHGVNQVSQSDYNSCTTGNAIKSYTGGQTTISLTQAGPMYFICPTFGHCAGGMKLAITVAAATTTGSSPTSAPPPPPPPPPHHKSDSGRNINQSVLGISTASALFLAFMG